MNAFILSYIDLPSLTAVTIVAKSSSASTISLASLATYTVQSKRSPWVVGAMFQMKLLQLPKLARHIIDFLI
jgi:hypothetical protein